MLSKPYPFVRTVFYSFKNVNALFPDFGGGIAEPLRRIDDDRADSDGLTSSSQDSLISGVVLTIIEGTYWISLRNKNLIVKKFKSWQNNLFLRLHDEKALWWGACALLKVPDDVFQKLSWRQLDENLYRNNFFPFPCKLINVPCIFYSRQQLICRVSVALFQYKGVGRMTDAFTWSSLLRYSRNANQTCHYESNHCHPCWCSARTGYVF